MRSERWLGDSANPRDLSVIKAQNGSEFFYYGLLHGLIRSEGSQVQVQIHLFKFLCNYMSLLILC
jgi:hypothetical protein